MLTTAAIAQTAALIGDPTRATMLAALMDGRALTAKELAMAAGVTAQTASGHLMQLTGAGLLAMERQGRHRYHRLASPAVASMLESIMSVAAAGATGAGRLGVVRVGPRDVALRHARTCYDHLAGQLAVAMADRMTERGQIEFSPDGGAITEDGTSFLRGLGVDLDAACGRAARRRWRAGVLSPLPGLERAAAAHRGRTRRGGLHGVLCAGVDTADRGNTRGSRHPNRSFGPQ